VSSISDDGEGHRGGGQDAGALRGSCCCNAWRRGPKALSAVAEGLVSREAAAVEPLVKVKVLGQGKEASVMKRNVARPAGRLGPEEASTRTAPT
jgi:hypothetical protein